MTEIESSMKDCHINMEEEKNPFYKVIKNDHGKFGYFGCLALQDIKAGTIILKEKPQCVPKIFTKWDPGSILEFTQESIVPDYLSNLLNSYFSMSKSCQEDFMSLMNKYLDPNSLPDHHKKNYLYWKKSSEEASESSWAKKFNIGSDFILEVICIFISNFQRTEENPVLSINASKFNHSCGTNAELFHTEKGDIEIRTTSKIFLGEQITITKGYGSAMKKWQERQNYLYQLYCFTCNCHLCQTESEMLKHDDGFYENFQRLKNECEKIKNIYPHENVLIIKLNMAEKHINCIKKLYNLARIKRAPKGFIFGFVNDTFQCSAAAYSLAKKFIDYDSKEILAKMKLFHTECETMAKIAYQIAKIGTGKNSPGATEWKEISQDFEGWQDKMQDRILGQIGYATLSNYNN